MPHLLEDPMVGQEVSNRVRRLWGRWEGLESYGGRENVTRGGWQLVINNLTNDLKACPTGDERDAVHAARAVLEHLVSPQERNVGFWGSPLGRAVAWWTGGHGEMTMTEVAAVLGVTKQAVFQMIANGRLSTTLDAQVHLHVEPKSLRDMLRAKNPQEGS